jgi:glycosyltransferase involved in cell wall biosynthesis
MSNDPTPLVSVIVPAWNAARFIADTIRSVQQQTYTNWELIIVNDGSTDDTAKIIAGLNDPRIQLINQANAGVSAARNHGISAAKGELIAFLDADDLFDPKNLEEKVNLFFTRPEIDFVFSDCLLADENGTITGPAPKGKAEKLLENILLWNGEVIPAPCSNLVVRSKCFDEGVRFDAEFSTAADQDLTLQLCGRYNGFYLAKTLVIYRVLGNSMSRNIAVMEKDHIGVYRKAARNGLFASPGFRRRCFSNLYLILAGSWWVNGGNKKRGLYFLLKSFFTWPRQLPNILRKAF